MRLRSAEFFRTTLAHAGKSYRELEALTGVDDSTISLLATGRRDRLPQDKAERLCAELGIDVQLLFASDMSDVTTAI